MDTTPAETVQTTFKVEAKGQTAVSIPVIQVDDIEDQENMEELLLKSVEVMSEDPGIDATSLEAAQNMEEQLGDPVETRDSGLQEQ
ncbi:hypothetical protein GOP47_0021043 [Adiantum capillus-veneris]|uniref:Uncharacterized protein n=1 Tax=Adiantum capillus-veneris TaxID=13818 RepID=A0A9D4Z6P5_ADICA|nr:hypothetical protein GOP47_0021043 [Adiantum capillus-veneris]